MEIPFHELDLGQSHEFTTLWMVFGGYEITGGVLRRSSNDVVAMYPPIRRREIPGELAKLTRGDEAAVIHFAQRYGMLGYDNLVGSDEVLGGDPVDWLWTHAETIRICLDLTEMLQEDRVEEVEPYLRSVAPPKEERQRLQLFPSSLFIKFAAKGRRDTLEIAYEEKNSTSLARLVCRNLTNPNIDRIHRELQGHGKTMRSFFHFSALIEVAYWQLADIVEGGRVVRCAECGALFPQKRRSQQYCPAQFRQQQSPCGGRARARRYNQQHDQTVPTVRMRSII
jgi:hypothetical protein